MPKSVDTQERHAAIHRAVVNLATAEGFEAVTVRAIAAQLSASTSVVTHYFATRDALVAATLRHELDSFARAVDAELAGLSGAAALRTLVSYVVFDAPRDLREFWMRAVIDAPREAVIRSELRRFDEGWDARLAELVAELDAEQGATHPHRTDQIDLLISGAVMMDAEGVEQQVRRRATESLLELILAR